MFAVCHVSCQYASHAHFCRPPRKAERVERKVFRVVTIFSCLAFSSGKQQTFPIKLNFIMFFGLERRKQSIEHFAEA
jgi:hypothetical protein